MSTIKTLAKFRAATIVNTYLLDAHGFKVNYVETLNRMGKVIDCELRTEDDMPLTHGHLLGSNWNSASELLDWVQVHIDKEKEEELKNI